MMKKGVSEAVRELYRFLTLRVLFPLQYNRYKKRPLIPGKAVFIESQLPGLSDSLRVLYDRMAEDKKSILSVHCLQESFVSRRTYILRALSCLRDMADAEYIFLCDASRLVSCISPRKETVITQLWHGCGAFKKFGMSTAELLFGGTRKQYEKYPYYGNLDLVTVSGPEVIWAYEEAMDLPADSGKVRAVGVSRTDVFFDPVFVKKAAAHVREILKPDDERKILLYAPTFRGNVSEAKAPDALDIRRLQEEFGDSVVLLIKHHPVAGNRPRIPKEAEGFAFDVTDTLPIGELLCAADICISDYSSLVFEYSIFERPMIFYAYDLEEYGDWRGFYYDYEELTPGPVVRTAEELAKAVREAAQQPHSREAAAFREKYMSACDGHATERILALVKERRQR